MRRAGGPVWAPVLAVVLLTASACGGSGDERAGSTTTGAPAASPSAASVQPAPSPTAPSAEVDRVVTDFLTALGDGESGEAWELLTPAAQDSFGSVDDFAADASAYAEGLAAFVDLPRSTFELSGDVVLVTMAGEVTREGMTERDAATLPVRVGDGPPRVELVSPGLPGLVDIEVPPVGTEPVAPGTTLRAYVPAASEWTVLLDGEPVTAQDAPADGDRVELTLAPDLGVGEHVLVVAAVRADGLVATLADAFEVQA